MPWLNSPPSNTAAVYQIEWRHRPGKYFMQCVRRPLPHNAPPRTVVGWFRKSDRSLRKK